MTIHRDMFDKPKNKRLLEIGELVRVASTTYQEGMAPSRIGVVTGIGQDATGKRTGVYKVMFASSEGQVEMTFWHKFLERVSP
tara:strand:- start:346 stop:594 length:249 start_codon:yes stop_codon:yes gene_type:complete